MGFDVSYGTAFIAGLASFLTPCILPIVPFYLCYITGLSFEDLSKGQIRRGRVIASAVAFALGMSAIFIGLGAAATAFGEVIRGWSSELRWAAAAVILVLGLHYLGVFRIGFLMREARIDTGERRWGVAGAFLVGAAFAFGWTPCAGPILAAILFMAGEMGDPAEGALLLGVYAAGMTLPFVLAAIFIGPFLDWAKRFRRHLPKIERGIGIALVIFAVLIATNKVNYIANWMLLYAPDLGLAQ